MMMQCPEQWHLEQDLHAVEDTKLESETLKCRNEFGHEHKYAQYNCAFGTGHKIIIMMMIHKPTHNHSNAH